MVRVRAAFAVAVVFCCALGASAATITVSVLLDSDNSATTGCSVAGVSGIDQVLITTVNVTGTAGTVSKVEQQQCTSGTLSSPVAIDSGGWPVSIAADKGVVETHLPFSALGGHLPSTMRLAFSVTVGTQTAVLSQLPDHSAILFPQAEAGRHRAIEPGGGSRTIVLDGKNDDWSGIAPLVSGGQSAGSAAVKFFNIYAFAGASDLFFDLDARVNSGSITAIDDSYSVRQGGLLTVVAPGVLGNDTSTTSSPLSASLVTAPAAGTVTLKADGSFTYTHNGSAALADSFRYKATDGLSESNVATVSIAIIRNNPPTAVADSYTVARGLSITVPPRGVLSNDTDLENDPLTARLVTPPAHGTIALDPNGGFRYTHDDSNTTSDSFSYSARDPYSTSAPVVDTITVLPRNHAPSFTAGPDQSVLDTAGPQTVSWATNISAGPPDEAGELLNFIVSNNSNALFTAQPAISPAGTLTFTPAAGQTGDATVTVQLHDNGGTANGGIDTSSAVTFLIHVNKIPVITSAAAATFTTGVAGTFSVTATARPAANIVETGSLPAGVTFTNASPASNSGVLAGTPGAGTGGVYNLTFTATNSLGSSAPQAFTLTVNQPPAITSAATTAFVTGVAGTFTFTSTGFPASTLSETGALPTGVTFTNNGNGTATLAGTPASGTGGSYTVTITASNGVSPNAVQSFVLLVDQPPAFTSSATGTWVVGSNATFSVGTTGYPPAAITIASGTLPSGLSLVDNHNGTAFLTGTPAAGTGGTYVVVLNANNGIGSPAAQTFTLTVDQPPAITSANGTAFTAGAAGTFTVTTTGFPAAVALSEAGALPAGVTFTDNGNGTATLAGTPASGTGGVYAITIAGNNGVAPNASQTFTLTVNEAPKVTSATSTIFLSGTAGTFTVTTSGFPTAASMVLSETGALPSGVTFTDNRNGTATIAGTSTATGDYPITIGASNGIAPAASQNFTLHVYAAPLITSASSIAFTVNTAGTFTVTTTAFPTATLSESGALPAGVTFTNNGNGTATIAGTPTVTGNYPITITAANGVTPNGTQNFTLTVQQVPAITSASSTTFAPGKSGQTFTVTTTGFPAPAITMTGTFPTGVTLTDNNNGTATISGTPASGTAGGSPYSISITASNGVTPNATQTFTLNITCPTITVSNGAIVSPTYNVAMTPVTFTQSGGNGTIAWSAVGLPPGVSINPSTGVVSGTPTATGTFSATINATDAGGCSGTKIVSIAVGPSVPGQLYTGVGNTQLYVVGVAGAPTAPAISSTTTLLTSVSPSANTTVTTASCTTGGTLTAVDPAGHFIFTPNVSATSASCTYLVSSDSGGTGTPVTVSTALTFTLSGTVWYVDNSSTATHDGRSNTPFLDLGAGAGNLGSVPTSAGDFIYVSKGNANYTGARTLLASQSLIGAGATLTVGGNTVVAGNAANTPTLGGGITIANSVTIAGINLSTGSAAALTGTGTGINVTVSSLNTAGAANGINLSNSTGSLTLNSGFIDASTADGVTLTGALNVSFTNLSIHDTSHNAVSATGLSGFAMTNGSILNSGTAGSSYHGVHLIDTTGAVTIAGTTISGSNGNNLWIDTTSSSTAAMTSLTCSACTLSSSTTGDGLLVTLNGTSGIATGTISSCTMSSNTNGYGLDFVANGNASIGNVSASTSAGAVTVSGSTFQSNNFGASFADGGGTGASNMYVRFTNNTLTGQNSHAVNVVSGATSTGGTQKVLISGNFIGNATSGSGSAIGEGIVVTQQGKTTQTVTITNNVIREVPNGRGIDVQALGPVAAGATATSYPVNYVLTGNNVNPGVAVNPLYAIYVAVDDQGSPTSVNTELNSNIVQTTAACDTACTASTGMIFYELVNGASAGTLYNPGGNLTVSNEIANTNTGTTGKTCSSGALALTSTAPPTVN